MNDEIILLGLALLAGVTIGVFFFGGLWLTVRRIPTSNNPGLLLMVSLIVRMAVALGAFFLIMDGSWQRLLVSVVGFILARQLLIQRWGPDRNSYAVAERSPK